MKMINTNMENKNKGNKDIKKNRAKGKIFALMLAVTLIGSAFALTGCGDSNSSSTDKSAEDAEGVKSEKIGTWLSAKKKSTVDDKEHGVKFKITKIATDEKTVMKEIEEYNVSGATERIDTGIGNEDLQYQVAYYEVKFPEDFPDDSFGITDVAIPFTITATDGSDVIKYNNVNYPNLTDTIEIGSMPAGYDFYAGQTYKGKIAYVMVKDCKEYRLKGAGHYIKP